MCIGSLIRSSKVNLKSGSQIHKDQRSPIMELTQDGEIRINIEIGWYLRHFPLKMFIQSLPILTVN